MTLRGSLDVTVDGGVQFAFAVRNDGEEPVELAFPDALEADFAVLDDGEVWRFSEGRLFAQALGSETIAPGEVATYEASWDDPDPGEYAAVATLEAREQDCEARVEFSVDGDR
ncbi:BsuPI-related putative proteinase inhibitor [Halostella salina]|uniref:BsuPI-related putative proteinase inhibitor n=1 Tax=Halostella salina TaxID=1547897 RepID=UPI000EF7CD9D|nr:BsuPI-related putative proteinase inhibitor [Halostella salina]